ncbi:heme exporter protein CcmD [uncultured Thiodictyon sp.]|uniref:heme exporter protein CcmD n=1 Tax=uncultured Thiodictyon sp. TaxID=1846217 RepID=UPI0025E483C2|nr:heme exporter protein CcmD [uncultured Thiodictyon sp.]
MMEFLAQGGFAGYVWSAYGMTLALLVIETVSLRRQRRAILARLSRLLRLRGTEDHRGDQP